MFLIRDFEVGVASDILVDDTSRKRKLITILYEGKSLYHPRTAGNELEEFALLVPHLYPCGRLVELRLYAKLDIKKFKGLVYQHSDSDFGTVKYALAVAITLLELRHFQILK